MAGSYAPVGPTVRTGLGDWATGRERLCFFAHEKGALSVAFAPDGRTLVTSGGDKMIRRWDAATGQKLREFKGHEDWVSSIALSASGRFIASASFDKTVRLWE